MARRKNGTEVEARSTVPPCIADSEYFKDCHPRTRKKMQNFAELVKKEYPEIQTIAVEGKVIPNRAGRMVGVQFTCKIESEIESIDHTDIVFTSSKPLSDISYEILFRLFRKSFEEYKLLTNY